MDKLPVGIPVVAILPSEEWKKDHPSLKHLFSYSEAAGVLGKVGTVVYVHTGESNWYDISFTGIAYSHSMMLGKDFVPCSPNYEFLKDKANG